MENKVNSFISLYAAYKKTRCGKRDNPTAMRYRMEAIERTVDLSERLQRREYTFGPYYPFKVYEPKERLVLAIDFEGNFYQLANEAPMTILSPEQAAAREKAKKAAAVKAAKEQGVAPEADDMEAKLAAMDPKKAAKVRAAMEAKAKKEAAAKEAEIEGKLKDMDSEKAAKVRAAMEAKAKKAASRAEGGE